jgi:hypothetical protein
MLDDHRCLAMVMLDDHRAIPPPFVHLTVLALWRGNADATVPDTSSETPGVCR